MPKRTSPKAVEPAMPPQVAKLVPKSLEEAEILLSQLGTSHRTLDNLESLRDAEIAEAHARWRDVVAAAERRTLDIVSALHVWAENNRVELTKGGRHKSARLATGTVSWRKMPDTLSVVDEKSVIEQIEKRPELKELFLRVTTTLDKNKMLAERDKATSLPGVTIRTGIEVFEAKPAPINPKE